MLLQNHIPIAPTRLVNTSFTSTSTAAVDLGLAGQNSGIVVLCPSQNCYVNFGAASVSAATSLHTRLAAGEWYAFRFSAATKFFRVIRQTSDGVLQWFIDGCSTFPEVLVPDIGVEPIALWDARSGIETTDGLVDSWTDLIGEVPLSALLTERPMFAADGANFKGRRVVRFDGVDDRLENLEVDPAIYAASSEPEFFMVARYPAAPEGQTQFWWAANALGDSVASVFSYVGGLRSYFDGLQVEDAAPPDFTDVHLYRTKLTSAGVISLSIDNGTATTGETGLAVGPLESLTLGNTPVAVGSFPAALRVCAFGIYAAELTAAQQLALLAHYQYEWGAP